jgi:serine/threonine-protein kinase
LEAAPPPVDAARRVERPPHVEPRTRPRPRPTPPAPPPAATAAPGFYIVDSRPYARIYIDGKDHGETPLFRVPLSPGRHAVRAELPDGRKKQFTIEIKPGKDLSSGRLHW